jgi:hypothetical protein
LAVDGRALEGFAAALNVYARPALFARPFVLKGIDHHHEIVVFQLLRMRAYISGYNSHTVDDYVILRAYLKLAG